MPYTEIKERIYDYSGLSQWMLCQRKWYWYAVRDLVLDVPHAALTFGAAIHKGLEGWFQGGTVEDMLGMYRQEIIERGGIPADSLRTEEKGEIILKAYAKQWPRPEPFKVLATEQAFVLEMADGSKLAGRMDGVVEWDDRILVLEHKTTSGGIGSYYFKQFTPNIQVDVYAYACRRIFGRCDGVLVDALQVCKTKEGFARDVQDRTPEDLARFEKQYLRLVADIEAKDEADGREVFVQNQLACTYFGECPYRTLCMYNNDGLIEGRYVEREKMELPEVSDE